MSIKKPKTLITPIRSTLRMMYSHTQEMTVNPRKLCHSHSSPEMKVADESGDHYSFWLHPVRPSLTEHDRGHVLGEDGKTLTHCDKRISQRSISELLVHLLQPTSDPLSSPLPPFIQTNYRLPDTLNMPQITFCN